jgi:hypothetical protein
MRDYGPNSNHQGAEVRRIRVAVIVGLAIAVAGCSSGKGNAGGSDSQRSTPSTSAPSALSGAAALKRVSWQNGDLRAPYVPVLYDGGNDVAGQVTLDMCGASFPSEQRRRERHQVGVEHSQLRVSGISIEAVLYDAPAGAVQAMQEIRAAKAHCPSGYAKSTVAGVPPLRYRFAPAPDGTWAKVKNVDRFVMVVTINDQQGHSQLVDLVYQQRGRLLVGFYTNPTATATALTRSLEGFSEVLASRMAALPDQAIESAVNA